MNLRNLAIWGVIAIAVLVVFGVMQGQRQGAATPQEMPYSVLLSKIDAGDVIDATIHGRDIEMHDKEKATWHVVAASENNDALAAEIHAKGGKVTFLPPGPTLLVQILVN